MLSEALAQSQLQKYRDLNIPLSALFLSTIRLRRKSIRVRRASRKVNKSRGLKNSLRGERPRMRRRRQRQRRRETVGLGRGASEYEVDLHINSIK